MTKSKKLVSRMMFALLVLTLVSFCFVGFTFARYTSSGNGIATATIAKWDVSAGEGDIAVTFNKLSPSMKAPTESHRSNTTDAVAFLTITNNGEVDANVTVALAETPITIADAEVTASTLQLADIARHFSITFYTDSNCTTELTDAVKVVVGGTATIYAKVTWKTDLYNDDGTDLLVGAAADAEDTLIGQHITKVTFNIVYTAVQASELPQPPVGA